MPLPIHGLEHRPLSMAPIPSPGVTLVGLLSFFIFHGSQYFLPRRAARSIEQRQLTNERSSRGKSKSMVFFGGPSVHHCRVGHGVSHDTRPWIPLFGPGEEKIRSDHALDYHGLLLRHYISMVLLGLFAGIFGTRNKRLHWRPQALWLDQHARRSESWVAIDSGAAVQLLSGTRSIPLCNPAVYADPLL